ncbi:hypothetical protein GCM10009525_53480 [Streptosporangium amethystogenes subsp. fukuiense]
MTLLALTPVWVNPQRGHAGSTAGAFWILPLGAVVGGSDAAVEGASACRVAVTAWSGVLPKEQLAAIIAVAMTPAAEATTRPGRHHVDPSVLDDT